MASGRLAAKSDVARGSRRAPRKVECPPSFGDTAAPSYEWRKTRRRLEGVRTPARAPLLALHDEQVRSHHTIGAVGDRLCIRSHEDGTGAYDIKRLTAKSLPSGDQSALRASKTTSRGIPPLMGTVANVARPPGTVANCFLIKTANSPAATLPLHPRRSRVRAFQTSLLARRTLAPRLPRMRRHSRLSVRRAQSVRTGCFLGGR
jgi:hypothetical protein